MQNTYKIIVSDTTGVVLNCTHHAERFTCDQIPYQLLDTLGQRYAPCHIKCICTNEGWYSEKTYS